MGAQLASPRSGRAAILDAIRAAGSISRVELVRSTGCTGATVPTAGRRLSEEGLVVETLLDQGADGRGDCRARAPGAPDELCLLYTSDAADDEDSVDLGGRRIIKQ